MKRYILAGVLFCIPIAAYAITTNFSITVAISALNSVFDCSAGFSSNTSSPCYATFQQANPPFMVLGSTNGSTPGVEGTAMDLIPAGGSHQANNFNYRTATVNVGQFSTTFTYVPNGANMFAFVLQNNTLAGSTCLGTGNAFSCGATDEGSFTQIYIPSTSPPNNVFAVAISQTCGITANSDTFTYSSVQYYSIQGLTNTAVNAPNPPGMYPCNGAPGSPQNWTPGFNYVGVNRVSTSPVALNNPANTAGTATGHTYSVTIAYDGSNLTFSMFDVTAGGACPGAACFTTTWTGVNIPAIVGGSTAWMGFGGSTGGSFPTSLLIQGWKYSSN